jgi:hypothetical protein
MCSRGEERFDRVEHNAFRANLIDGVAETDKESFEVVLSRFLDFRALDVHPASEPVAVADLKPARLKMRNSMMNLQIVIRSRDHGAYLDRDERWSMYSKNARSFGSAAEAEEFCRTNQLQNVEIHVLRPGRPTMRIPVKPVSDAPPGRPSRNRHRGPGMSEAA